MSKATSTLDIWKRLTSFPGGKWMFSRLLCFKAPYFGSIRPRFVAGEYKVKVVVSDRAGKAVFQALITMWVSPKKAAV